MTKGEYYHARDNYSRQYRRLGRCLFLAETEEEDARYWRLYKSNLENWRRLQVPESMPTPTPLLRKTFYRPVFNEEYSVKDYRILSPPKRTQQSNPVKCKIFRAVLDFEND